ncbi:MAG: usg protein [Alphaproteobacteria bacterium]
MSNLKLQLLGHRLTTAEIIYRLPDHPSLLQTFVWQSYDMAPRYPTLTKFLRYWEHHIEGALHIVRVASAALVKPAEFRFVKGELHLH